MVALVLRGTEDIVWTKGRRLCLVYGASIYRYEVQFVEDLAAVLEVPVAGEVSLAGSSRLVMVGFLTLVFLAVLHQSRGAFEVVHGAGH